MQMLYFLISCQGISVVRQPITTKFCTMVESRANLKMQIQNSGGPPPKKFSGPKHAKFGPILNDFKI